MTVELNWTQLDAPLVPMALRDLHGTMEVDDTARITFADHTGHAWHQVQGSAHAWSRQRLGDVLEGAGFALDAVGNDSAHDTDRPRGTGAPQLIVTARRIATLADTVGPGMRLLLVGLNPSPHAVASGVGFSGPSNRGWPALMASGLATADRDPDALLSEHRIGMTDMVKRATRRASELAPREYASGLERLERLCGWLAPAAVCVVGLAGWRAAVDRAATPGHQDRALGGRPVWLMPNPSGLNAHVRLGDLVEHLLCAAALADAHPR